MSGSSQDPRPQHQELPQPTYEKLNEGLDCECNTVEGAGENTVDHFARLVKHRPPKLRDFRSYREERTPLRGNTVRIICMHRGVTIIKVTSANEDLLKQLWADEVQIKPISHIYCRFKLKAGAGLVWPTMDTNSSRADRAAHHTLLKCDTFAVSRLEILDVCSLK